MVSVNHNYIFFYFIFIMTTCFGQFTIIRSSLQKLRNTVHEVQITFVSYGIPYYMNVLFLITNQTHCRSQWPRGLRRRSTAARLLLSWVRIPPRAWMFVCCECCVLSGRGLCDGLIIRSEESYRLWRVVVCDQETS